MTASSSVPRWRRDGISGRLAVRRVAVTFGVLSLAALGLGVPACDAGSGGPTNDAGSGGSTNDAGSGGSATDAGSGTSASDAGSGGSASDAGSGGTASDAGSGEAGGGTAGAPLSVEDYPLEFAEVVCSLGESCGCSIGDSAEACVSDLRVGTAAARDAALDGGLVFDQVCARRFIESYEALGCAAQAFPTLPQWDWCDQRVDCEIFTGGVGEGEPCARIDGFTWSDCQPGLTCAEGSGEGAVCAVDDLSRGLEALCDLIGLGGTCLDEDWHSLGYCDRGLMCDLYTRECVPLPRAGQPCESRGSMPDCDAGLYCDFSAPEPECVGAPTLGEDCSQTDRTCATGACEYDSLGEQVCVAQKARICQVFGGGIF